MWCAETYTGEIYHDPDREVVVEWVTQFNRGRMEHSDLNAPPGTKIEPPESYAPTKVWEGWPPEYSLEVPR